MNTINTYYEDYQALVIFIKNNHDMIFAYDNRSVLVQIFSGVCDRGFLELLSRNICKLVPHAQIIGTTTSGEIMNGTVSGLKTVLSFSVFKQSDIKIAFEVQEGKNSYELGRSIATKLNSERAKLIILFSTGLEVNASKLLSGVQAVNPHLPVAGGSAGDNFFTERGFVFCNNIILDNGVVGVVLEGEHLSINQNCHICWVPIGKEMSVTKADGLRVHTIDHMPAYQIYKKYLGVDGKSNMINFIFPLVTNRHGVEIVRPPFKVNEDGSIDFLAEIYEGEKVRFSFGHVDMIIEANDKLIQKIKEWPAESIFVYSCALRRGFLQESTEIETLPLQAIAPTAGFFTNGEFYHADNTNQYLNATMTTLALSEFDQNKEKLIPKQKKSECQENADIAVLAIKDEIESQNIQILKPLTYLVNMVTNELYERSTELEKVNEQIQYTSMHDPLTGIYNRSFYEQKMKYLENSCNDSLGIIICDVDGLKLVNDTLGHTFGDAILKATADILKSLFSSDGVVARIGGDEFSILLPNSLLLNVESSCRRIHEAVSNYNTANPTVPLSISVGFSSCENAFKNTKILFAEADNSMYREKLHRSKSIRSDLIRTLIKTLEARDIITEEHGNRLQNSIATFAEFIGFPQSEISNLRLFARFHDIGKVGIPDIVLFKPGMLTLKEKEQMQRHSEIGYRIAQSSADLLVLADLILKHHEWWNGKGYPLGLKGKDIPIECRILAVVDAYDAMTSDRPYRQAMSHKAAIEELKRCARIQFDPKLIEQFISYFNSKDYKE